MSDRSIFRSVSVILGCWTLFGFLANPSLLHAAQDVEQEVDPRMKVIWQGQGYYPVYQGFEIHQIDRDSVEKAVQLFAGLLEAKIPNVDSTAALDNVKAETLQGLDSVERQALANLVYSRDLQAVDAFYHPFKGNDLNKESTRTAHEFFAEVVRLSDLLLYVESFHRKEEGNNFNWTAYTRGVALLKMQKNSQAVESFQKIENPDFMPTKINGFLATALLNLEKREEMKSLIEETLTMEGLYGDAITLHHLQAQAGVVEGDLEFAKKSISKAIGSQGSDNDIYFNLYLLGWVIDPASYQSDLKSLLDGASRNSATVWDILSFEYLTGKKSESVFLSETTKIEKAWGLLESQLLAEAYLLIALHSERSHGGTSEEKALKNYQKVIDQDAGPMNAWVVPFAKYRLEVLSK